jgi:hypothetical protein
LPRSEDLAGAVMQQARTCSTDCNLGWLSANRHALNRLKSTADGL